MSRARNYHYPTIGTEAEIIKHYGMVKPCFDLHPQQVQPSHIVVTSPWFNTKPHNIGKSPKPRQDQIERRRERILHLKEEGLTHTEIGLIMDIEPTNVCRMIKRWGKS